MSRGTCILPSTLGSQFREHPDPKPARDAPAPSSPRAAGPGCHSATADLTAVVGAIPRRAVPASAPAMQFAPASAHTAAATLPVVPVTVAENESAQSEDGVGYVHRPVHPRAIAAFLHNRFAVDHNHLGTAPQALPQELAVMNPLPVGLATVQPRPERRALLDVRSQRTLCAVARRNQLPVGVARRRALVRGRDSHRARKLLRMARGVARRG